MRVEIQQLRFGYDAKRAEPSVFHDLDLSIESGSVHALLGPTGCGKSTLLRLIAGLEPVQGGSIRFVGPRLAPHRTAVVFQDPALVPSWTVGRNVGIGVEFDAARAPLYSKVTSFNVDRVGLRGLVRRLPYTLSRGEKAKASIGRAMAYDADVMLLDEPFTHLDVMTKRRLWAEFETHWQLEARTYLLVTHDIEEAVLLADRVTVLSGASSTGPTRVVETIELGLSRPRRSDRLAEPAYRAAIGRVWDALGLASS
jgi:NitT/TauT family transport system ATP-binding protein